MGWSLGQNSHAGLPWWCGLPQLQWEDWLSLHKSLPISSEPIVRWMCTKYGPANWLLAVIAPRWDFFFDCFEYGKHGITANRLVISIFAMRGWYSLTSNFVRRPSFASGYHNQEFHNAIIDTAGFVNIVAYPRMERVKKQSHVWLPLWTMNTSCSRTEQPMLTDVSPFENFLRSALLELVPSRSQMASVSEGWEDPEKIWTLRIMIKSRPRHHPNRDNWSYPTWDRLKL